MFGGDTNNSVFPVLLDENQFQYDSNASTQLQLFGNFPAGCTADPTNYITNDHISSLNRPNKRIREAEDLSRQKRLHISLNPFVPDEVDRPVSISNQNGVSTGLRLSYDDDERNSSITTASGSISALPIIMSLGDNLRTEIDRQKEEFDHYIRIQEENIMKGVKEMKQRHMASFLNTVEKGISQRLQEKELEIENMNRKNKELVERIKQVAVEAQSWYYRAYYNESMVNTLKANLKQAITQGADQAKEGCGDSEVDDAASSHDPNLTLEFAPLKNHVPKGATKATKEQMVCRSCKVQEVSMLILPCRHLCLCSQCERFIEACPLCQTMKTTSIQIYMS
ncbi:hypothetical protein QJS10_CPB12g00163 [Acorus calamus]|uniref:RING-type domain-containing protein n=1 Tax=Acorus calamus TaxID=4465 RepID=A0AAV9DLM2_ACOCL|nr:hypothetical protein QJS10_CPB12g00163 [Acorus calamus]